MSWGLRRRNNIIFAIFLLITIPIVVSLFLMFYEKPTCFDGKKNQDEKGIDCGGSCLVICKGDSLTPVVLWKRFFKVSEGNYNVGAYIENQNQNAGVKNAKYVFSLYNQQGVRLAEKKGSIRLLPNSITPVLENGLITLKQEPVRVEFDFVEQPVFELEYPVSPVLIIKDSKYFIDDSKSGGPRVTATIQNISLEKVNDIEIIVLLYDLFDNVIGSSSTFIEKIEAEESVPITFTWPIDSFTDRDLRPEIIPIYEPVN